MKKEKSDIGISKDKGVFCANCGYLITVDNPYCACHEFVRRMKAKNNKEWLKFINEERKKYEM